MRVFYRSSTVLVTDRIVAVSIPPKRTVDLRELRHLYVIRANLVIPTRALTQRLLPVLVVAVAVLMLSGTFSSLSRTVLVSAATLTALAGIALCVPGRAQHVNELWAVVNGRHLCLFRTTDERTFEQVRRAVVRARESLG